MKETFDSLSSFYSAASAGLGKFDDDPSFQGCSKKEAFRRRWTWGEGIATLSQLPDLSAPVSAATYEKRWSDYDGDDMDPERFRDEMPFLSRRYKVAGDRRSGPVRVVVNITENGGVSAKSMLWKAYAAARLVQQIEETGARAEVLAAFHIVEPWSNRRDNYEIMIYLKRAEDPLILPALVSALTPWFFRVWGFAHLETLGKCYSHKGRAAPVKIPPAAPGSPALIVIDKGQCLTKEAAVAFIQRINEHRGARAAA